MSQGVAAIVLTGGRGSRLGGVDKARLSVGGRAMGDAVLEAAGAVADPVLTVGPGSTVREPVPFSGPVAGIAAGLAALPFSDAPVVLLACDLPDLDAATVRVVVAALGESPRGTAVAVAVDASGRDQYLLAAWDRHALAVRLAELGDPVGRPVRALYEGVPVARIDVGAAARDVDTWSDVGARGPAVFTDVRAILCSALDRLLPTDRAPLEAIGAVLAAPLVAVDPMPRGRVSAMDGYALSGAGPWRLVGSARRAGDDSPARVEPGTAVAIATGALAPDGTDRVLRHELVEVMRGPDADTVVASLPSAGVTDDLRPVGEDWPSGYELAPAGTTFDAALASAALSAGLTQVSVRGPVRATIVTTGDEVLPADSPSPLPPGRTRDTVGPVLGDVLARGGFARPGTGGHCRDEPGALDVLLAGPDPAAEVLVLVGATGRGAADHLRHALARAGARIVLDGVRVRPGGSQIVAVLPDGRVLLGLPGNPLAAVCAAATTGRVVVDALTGRDRTAVRATVAGTGALASKDRARLLPARPDGAGGWSLADRVRTAHLADLGGAPALAVLPENARGQDPVELVDWI